MIFIPELKLLAPRVSQESSAFKVLSQQMAAGKNCGGKNKAEDAGEALFFEGRSFRSVLQKCWDMMICIS